MLVDISMEESALGSYIRRSLPCGYPGVHIVIAQEEGREECLKWLFLQMLVVRLLNSGGNLVIMGFVFLQKLNERLAKERGATKTLISTLEESLVAGCLDIPLIRTYPAILPARILQISGKYDKTMTKVPVLYDVSLELPAVYVQAYAKNKKNKFIITVLPDENPEEGLPENFFKAKERQEEFNVRELKNNIVRISREQECYFPGGLHDLLSGNILDFRTVINSKGWLRGTDQISIDVQRPGKQQKLLNRVAVHNLIESQYESMRAVQYEAYQIQPKKDNRH